ncbi:MAG: argininosuccinate lyase [Gammaproteobacteria bacterium]|nr:argininosuccinate lyase [Gammaproteobacteria bacterium]MDH4253936.1 argininosuccinate lyase [Gammaproteobacteria bacterium]MDH5310585.1 argininosuccinate lyase [Gammaproteobacteria bacterium]
MPGRRQLCTALLLVSAVATAAGGDRHDDFAHLVEINEASLVMLAEQSLLPEGLAVRIADGIRAIDAEQVAPGSRRSSNYLVFEARLLELAGSEASRLHIGRSRQDIGSTLRRMALREALLDVFEALLEARAALLELAAEHVDTVIPAYTHGVQAQPTTLAHYLLAFAGAFERDSQRYREVYGRLNRSPLGAAALGTSGFPIERGRLAELLGFDAAVENSYDANLVASVDSKIEFANAMAVSAVPVGQLMQNLHTQYHSANAWILLDEEDTDVSSIMPQKRNPRPLDRVRTLATGVIGNAHLVTLNAHNTMSGMNDYRPADQALETAGDAIDMYDTYRGVLDSLVVSPDRALAEINAEYSTMTEVADTLLRHADVPFRVAHHYASELTDYGRSSGKRPVDISDAELAQVYRDAVGEPLPVDVELVRNAMDPQAMVRSRRGLGGPQPAEVRRMLDAGAAALAADRSWLGGARERLANAAAGRSRALAALQP